MRGDSGAGPGKCSLTRTYSSPDEGFAVAPSVPDFRWCWREHRYGAHDVPPVR
jgi:hypothetical protein